MSTIVNLKKEFLKLYTEIEFNATEDTLFERMTLTRLQTFSDIHFGTHLEEDIRQESLAANDFFDKGGTEPEWRRIIRQKRVKQIENEA